MGEAELEDKDIFGDERERRFNADLVGHVLLPAAGVHQIPEPVRAFPLLLASADKGGFNGAFIAAGYVKFEPKPP